MADIPHADGPYAQITTYGVKKATGIEATRRYLESHDFGWISAVTECQLFIVNGKETCSLEVMTSKNGGFNLIVKLTSRSESNKNTFPICFVEVRMTNYFRAAKLEDCEGLPKILYHINEDGDWSLFE